jgi:HlyD family secretion protein
LSGLALLPAMPVEAYIKTVERSAMSYLIKPLFDQINRAMWEDKPMPGKKFLNS